MRAHIIIIISVAISVIIIDIRSVALYSYMHSHIIIIILTLKCMPLYYLPYISSISISIVLFSWVRNLSLFSLFLLPVVIIIIIEGLSLLQSIPPTTADKQTQAQKRRGSRSRKWKCGIYW